MKLEFYLQLNSKILGYVLFFTLFISTMGQTNSQNRIFANDVIFSNNATNPNNALGNTTDFATLNSYGGTVLIDPAYTGEIELGFTNTIAANTTTYIKIDFDEDVLNSLLGGNLGGFLADITGTVILGNHYFRIEARNNATVVQSNSSVIPPSNLSYRIVSDLEGQFYIAITPDQSYNRIYIEDVTDALLFGTSHSMNVYSAFYFTENQCAIDPLFTDYNGEGITLDILTIGGAGVTNPEHAIDNDPLSYSEISMGLVNVIGTMKQNVYFPNVYTPTNDFALELKIDPTLLTVGILNNIKVTAYNGTTTVFEENCNNVITLELLGLLENGERASVLFSPGISFDRVSVGITSSLNVNVVQSLDFYGVTVIVTEAPTTNDTSQFFCVAENPVISNLQTNETNIIWYDQPIAGTAYGATDVLIDGLSYYASQVIDGCESIERLEVMVTIEDTPTPTTNNPTQSFCVIDDPTVADLDVNEPNITWYDAPTNGNPYASTDALINGLSYYAAATGANTCESSSRLEVAVTVEDTPTPTTNNATQSFCVVDTPTVADLDVNEPNITWYDALTNGNPYAPTDALANGLSYYAAATGANGCESSTRLAVAVTVEDTPTPTTNDATQSFCVVENPTVADLDVNEPNITWYDAPTNGNPYAPTDALVNGLNYYATATGANGCESSTRLAIAVIIEDTPTPTTNATTQLFCVIDEPTVADIDVNEPNITWYDAPINGNPYAPTVALVDGLMYYATATGANGCESSTRLAVAVIIEDTPTPTTNATTQLFCVIDEPTVADIDVNEPNITWYDAPTNGNPYASTDALVNGLMYYAAATGANGCESSTRLAVAVMVEDTPTPTTNDTTQLFCVINEPTVADLDVNEPNITWYDAPTNGNPYASTDVLIDGLIYYAAATGANGCESSTRLAVEVTVEDTPTPTTNNTTQSFCIVDIPTVADLDVNEPNITWYDAPINGNPYASTDALVNGLTYFATATGVTGCESSNRLEVLVALLEAVNPIIVPGTTDVICLNTEVTYSTEAGNSNYIWDISGGIVIEGGTFNDNYISIIWDSLENTNVSVSYTDLNSCGSGNTTVFDEEVQVCADLIILKTVSETNPSVGEQVTFLIKVSNNGPNDFTDILVKENMPSGYNIIDFSTTIGTYSASSGEWLINLLPTNEKAELTIIVEVLGQGDYLNTASIITSTPTDANDDNNRAESTVDPICLFVYNEFSPNDDGINDHFVISCLENFPNNELKVFNRYGSLVYAKKGYDNTWRGIANVSGVGNTGETLPSETYYYILEFSNDKTPMTGWLFLVK